MPREAVRHEVRHHHGERAERERGSRAYGDQREHVETAVHERRPAAYEERPATPQHDRRRQQELHDAERSVLGFDHAAVGASLADAWNLPPAFAESVRYQYQPQRATQYPTEAAAVHLATVVATGLEWGCGGETLVLPIEAAAWDTMGLDLDVLPGLLDDAERQYQAAVQAVAGALA